MPQGFGDASLLDDLKFVIARIICSYLKEIDERLAQSHVYLDKILERGNTVITSNWDYLLERACMRRDVPFRLRWYDELSAVTILKLHGSVDWTAKRDAKHAWGTANYYRLEDLIKNSGSRHDAIDGREIARCHSIENWTRGYQRIKGATLRPVMLTMARGKADNLRPLGEIWSDAYNVLSRAQDLHIVGYSLPDDDVEIRTLLRAGVCRGSKDPKVHVVNPAPDVHVRVRQQILARLRSDYAAVPGL